MTTADGALRPSTSLANSNSVGRNIFPFIPIRCWRTSSMSGMSSLTTRHISRVTWSSRSRTGAWMSRSAVASSVVSRTGALTWRPLSAP